MHQHSSLLHALAIRETGCCTLPAAIRRAVSGNVDTLHRLVLQHTLVGHEGCVNTVAFNQTGDILLSGSDDLSIILWQWREQRELLQYDSGHTSNVFQARALPHTNTSAIVTCARDGHIRLGRVAPDGTSSTSSLGRHRLAAHKLALDQQPQCVYSCGEDGKVMHLDTRAAQAVQTQFCCKLPALTMHNTVRPVGLYSIHCNPVYPWQVGVSGRDKRVLVYDVRHVGEAADPAPLVALSPPHLHLGVHGTCMQFSMWGEVVVSYNDEDAYLFAHPTTCARNTAQKEATATAKNNTDDDDNDDSDDDERYGRNNKTRHPGRSRHGPSSSAGPGPSSAQHHRGGRQRTTRGSHGKGSRGDKKQNRDRGSGATAALMDDDNGWGGDGGDGAVEPISQYPPPSGKQGAGKQRSCRGHRGKSDNSDDDGDGDDGQHERSYMVARYQGHRNNQTIKGISFFGANHEYIATGSDCGHVYVYNKQHPSVLEAWLEGDTHVVNCIEPHPLEPLTMVTSGIDDDIKVWQPTAESPVLPGKMAERYMQRNLHQRERENPEELMQAIRMMYSQNMPLELLLINASEGLRDEEEEDEDDDEEEVEEEEDEDDDTDEE